MKNEFIGVYFNPKYNGLHVLYSIGEDYLIVGGCCSYLADAYTNIIRHKIKIDGINDWILIEEPIRQYPFIAMKRKGIATGIKARLEDKTYLFYKDGCVLETEYLKTEHEDMFGYWL